MIALELSVSGTDEICFSRSFGQRSRRGQALQLRSSPSQGFLSRRRSNQGSNLFAGCGLALAVFFFAAAADAAPNAAASADAAQFADLVQRLGMKPADAEGKASQAAAQAAAERLIALGLAQNPSLAAAAARLAAAESGVAGAHALYQPLVSLSGTASRVGTRDIVVPGTARTDSRDLGLSLRQNIYHGGQDALDIDIAGAELALASVGRDQDAATLRFNVQTALLNYNQAAMQEVLARASESSAAALKKIGERKFSAGQVGKIDVHTAAQKEAQARASAVTARLSKTAAWYAVVRAVGVPTLAESEVQPLAEAALPYPPAPPPLDAKPQPTFDERTAAATVEKSERTLAKAYRTRLAPDLDFVASATRSSDRQALDGSGLNSAVAGADATSERVQTRLALELNWQLWDRPKDLAIARAAADADESRAHAATAKSASLVSLAELTRHIRELYAALPPYADAFEQAENVYEAQVKLYDAGAVEQAQVNNADADRVQAVKDWFGATQEIRTSLVRWEALKAGFIPASGS